MFGDHYRGWALSYVPNNPVTSRWVATKYGVRMNAHTKEALKSMIDERRKDKTLNVV